MFLPIRFQIFQRRATGCGEKPQYHNQMTHNHQCDSCEQNPCIVPQRSPGENQQEYEARFAMIERATT